MAKGWFSYVNKTPRRSGILLFPDCPRFCRLMKTQNRRYSRSSGMDGDKSGESGAFLLSRHDPDFCNSRQSFPTNENSNLYRRWCRRWISLITNCLNCWFLVPISKINMVSQLKTTNDHTCSYLKSLAKDAKKGVVAFVDIIKKFPILYTEQAQILKIGT